MFQRIREWLTLVLIGLLPLHAFLVTVGTKYLAGYGSAPLLVLALWKEAVLGVLFVFVAVEWVLSKREKKRAAFHIDRFDYCILLLLFVSVFVTVFTHQDWKLYLFGFKYDFVPLVSFFILRRCPWSAFFRRAALGVILVLGGLVSVYGLATLFLPLEFFRFLGYSDLHSLYLPYAPLAAFQQLSAMGARRIQSTFSGPNQLGIWLLLPWSAGVVSLFSAWFRAEHPLLRFGAQRSRRQIPWWLLYTVLVGAALFFTYSRTAWVAAAAVVITCIVSNLPWQRALQNIVRLCGLGAMLLVILIVLKPHVVLRVASTKDHLRKPIAAVQSILHHPFGEGLGIAGPASNRVSDACVFLSEGADTSWAADRPDLCVFTREKQVQPFGRACTCPRVVENWYLQIGVEMGVLGFFVYLLLICGVFMELAAVSALFLPFLAVSIAALFLHAWEGSAIAYTLWILLAVEMRRTD